MGIMVKFLIVGSCRIYIINRSFGFTVYGLVADNVEA